MSSVDSQSDGFMQEEQEEQEEALDIDENIALENDFPVPDTPEEITANEAEALLPEIKEIPEDAGHLTELVCLSCLELNLLTKSAIECQRCGHAFCFHYASTVDARYCVNCMSDISLTKQVITKIYEHHSIEGEVSYYRRRARDIKIEGLDWLFAQRKIQDMTDLELDLNIEYHRNLCGLLIAEQEKRRTERMHRYAGVRVVPPSPAVSTQSTITTTTKKTRTVSKNKAMEQLQALLKAQGLSPEQVAQILSKAQKN